MAAVGRFLLVITLVASPWAFGSVQAWPQLALAVVVLGLCVLRLFEAVTQKADRCLHIPLASVAPLVLLIIAALQLLPRAESLVTEMSHAVHSDDRSEFAGPESPQVGTLSTALTRREATRVFFAFAAFILASQWFASRQSHKWLLGALAVNGAALGFFGILQSLSWNGKLFWMIDMRFGGTPFASYVNRNNAAGYLNLCLAAAIGWAVLTVGESWGISRQRDRHHRQMQGVRERILKGIASIDGGHTAHIGLMSVMVAAVMFSLSRGGILAMMIAGVVVLAVAFRGVGCAILFAIMLMIGGLAVGLLQFAGRFESLDERVATLSDPLEAASGRLEHWQDTLGAVRDFPLLGTGLSTYRYANPPYQTRPSHAWYFNADNEWFELLVEIGVVGLATVMVGFFLTGIASLYLLRQHEAEWRAIGVLGLFILVSQILQGFTDFGLIIPANGLTFAVLCGCVCGSACRAADFHQVRVSSWLSLARLEGRPSQAFVSLVLVTVGAAFGLELFAATSADSARDVLIEVDRETTDVDFIDTALDRATETLRFRPDDGELHRSIGVWWISRYRTQMYQELLGDLTEPTPAQKRDLWNAVSLTSLSIRVNELRATGHRSTAGQLLGAAAVKDNLPQARAALAESLRHCPLGRNVALTLAKLVALDESRSPQKTVSLLTKSWFTEPSTPTSLIEAGGLAAAIGETALGDRLWKRAISVSPESAAKIWQVASASRPAEEILESVIPAHPEALLAVAEIVEDIETRSMLVKTASQLVQASPSESSAIVRAKLADLQSQPDQAIEQYRLALADDPWQIEWRMRLAQILRDQGRLSDAEAEYSLLSQQAPNRRDIQRGREEVIAKLIESGALSRPTVDESSNDDTPSRDPNSNDTSLSPNEIDDALADPKAVKPD